MGSEPGTSCPGLSEMSMACGVGVCPGSWQSWLPWSPCTRSCDGGTRRRIRICTGGPCTMGENSQEEECNKGTCGEWTMWSEWSACSKTCGADGRQSRQRTCQGDLECKIGEPTDSRPCIPPVPRVCPVADFRSLFQSTQGPKSIVDTITNAMVSQMQNPTKLISNLGLPSSLAHNGLPPLATFIFPLMNAVPSVTVDPGRPGLVKVDVAEQRRLIREGIEAAYERVKESQKN